MSTERKYNQEHAKRFKLARENAKLTQVQLAEKIPCCVQMISNYENGVKRITPQVAKIVAGLCGVNERFLLDVNVQYPNQDAEIAAVLNKADTESILLHRALLSLFELNGYDTQLNEMPQGFTPVNEIFDKLKKHLIVNDKVALSVDETAKLGNALNDMFLVLLKRYYDL